MNMGSETAAENGVLMGESKGSAPASPSETEITLGLLHAVHENSQHTQRSLARELGVALGLANAYLKRCVKKGLIKVTQVPANRYAYYLTPQGFVEKSRLTAEYLSQSFKFFREAREECADLYASCQARGWSRVALAGTGDLCEIAILCARDFPVSLEGVVEPGAGGTFSGLVVVPEVVLLGRVDTIIVTDMRDPQGVFESLRGQIELDRVSAPPLLKVSRRPPGVSAGVDASKRAPG